jgi:integrase
MPSTKPTKAQLDERNRWSKWKNKHSIKLSRKESKKSGQKRYCINYKGKTYYMKTKVTDWYNIDEYKSALADWEFIIKPDLDHPQNIGTFTRIRESDQSGNITYKDVWVENDVKKIQQLGFYMDDFLERKRNLDRSCGTIENYRRYVRMFVNYCGGSTINVNKVTEDILYKYRGHISRNKEWSSHTKNQIVNSAIAYTRHLFKKHAIPFFEIDYPELKIERIFKEVKIPPTEYVHTILDNATDLVKTFILLALNAGFYTSDIGDLRRDQLDLNTGILWHRRKKRKDMPNTPTIFYKLSNTTLEYVQKFAQTSGEYLFLTTHGNPYWRHEYKIRRYKVDGGFVEKPMPTKCDAIAGEYKKLTDRMKKEKLDTWSWGYIRKLSFNLMEDYDTKSARYMLGRFPVGVDDTSYRKFWRSQFLEVLPKFMKDTYNID